MARRGRPPLAEDEKMVQQTVRISPATADAICYMAAKRGVSVYALAGQVLERVFERYKNPPHASVCYRGSPQGSTLGAVLSESSGASGVGTIQARSGAR